MKEVNGALYYVPLQARDAGRLRVALPRSPGRRSPRSHPCELPKASIDVKKPVEEVRQNHLAPHRAIRNDETEQHVECEETFHLPIRGDLDVAASHRDFAFLGKQSATSLLIVHPCLFAAAWCSLWDWFGRRPPPPLRHCTKISDYPFFPTHPSCTQRHAMY